MESQLLSPIKIVRAKPSAPQRSFEISQTVTYIISESDLQIEAPINTFYSSMPTGPTSAVVPHLSPVTDQLAETFLRFQSLIGHCVTNAEDINNRLRDLLLKIRQLEKRKEEIMKMDFMKLRDMFSTFIKKHEPIKNDKSFDLQEFGALTTLMNQYILDRNIYTHGVLRIKRPDEIFVIDYIEHGKLKVRAQVNKEILASFLEMSKLIRHRLHDVRYLLGS